MTYYIATDRFGNYDLEHGAKWRQHKYIRKEGNRYIYPEDLKKGGSTSGSNSGSKTYIDDEYQRALASNSRPNVYPNSEVSKARDLAQQRGYSRTQYYKKDGFDSKSLTSYPNGEKKWNTEYTKPRLEREFEQNASERRRQQEVNKKRVAAERAVEDANRRGENRTHLEDRRALDREAARGHKLEEIRRRGEQQTYDIRERAYRVRRYNVSGDVRGAIPTNQYHGTGEYVKYESQKEHQQRLNAGAADRAASVKRKAAVNRAMNSVKKWGSNTLNSAKGAAAKGAAWVSNLLKRKK